MEIENKAVTTDEVLVGEYFETSAYRLAVNRKERELFLKTIGCKMKFGGDSEYAKILKGHQVLIGSTYKTIREQIGIEIEDIDKYCRAGFFEFQDYEECGFLNLFNDNLLVDDGDQEQIRLTAYSLLKQKISFYHSEFDSIPFQAILELNDAIITDIKRELYFLVTSENRDFLLSLRIIKKLYIEINDILEPYRTY